MDIPADVVAAQVAADRAWAAVESYRAAVDADRRTTAEAAKDRSGLPPLRPWTAEEDAEYDRLHATAVEAASVRRLAMRADGVSSTWETEREIRKAARERAAG
jgi:hypothetical protein